MLPKIRIYKAITGEVPDRVPSIPKIWVDLAAKLTNVDLIKVVKDPFIALKVILDAGLLVKADGVRQFHFPERKIRRIENKVYEVNDKNVIIGEIDMQGGLITQLKNSDNFNFEDPYNMAHHHYWAADKPFIENLRDAKKITIPDKKYFEEIGWGDRQREIIKLAGNKIALIGDCSSATMAFYVCMRGYNTALLDLIEKPDLVHKVMEKGAAIAIEKGKFNIDLGLKILRLNDSVGNMSVISPEHWRKFVKPHMKVVCDELHNYDPEVKIYCHICGNILPVVESLVETGIDCIGPLDPLGGFTPGQVREIVGNSVALYGGVNTLSFVNENPEEIITEAKKCIKEAGQKGNYILGSGCVIPRTASRENLEALHAAAVKYGTYPLSE